MEPQNGPKGVTKSASELPETLAAETTVRRIDARPAGAPAHVGRFRVVRVLGSGAFGTVYLATDTELGRQVAVKVPRAERLTPDVRQRFVREAKATATIDHPNVCPIHDVGTDADGTPYIVMKYVEGGTLADHLDAHGAMAPAAAVALARNLARGVAAAHAKGVVHRDLKPQNVLFDPARMLAVITDFGLAVLADDARTTADGAICGTPAYMSPEQAAGKAADVGPKSDVYSLGVILYHLLTGEVPFGGVKQVVLHQHRAVDPRPPSQVRAGLNPRLDAIVLKAMAKAPADRYPSAQALADALDEYQRGGGMVVPAPPAPGLRKPPSAPSARPAAPPARQPAPPAVPRPVAAPPPARRPAPPPLPSRPSASAPDRPVGGRPPQGPRRGLNRGLLVVAAMLLLVVAGLGVLAAIKSRTNAPADGAAGDAPSAGGANASGAGRAAGAVYVMTFGEPRQEMRFRWAPAGSFRMGGDTDDDEKPVHTVKISKGFWLAETETTQVQWRAVMGTNPSKVQGENLPVESVSWPAAREFCKKLSAASGKAVTLPTEAQWEYACRAGTVTRYHSGDDAVDLDRVAWVEANSGRQIHPVGLKEPNAWGLRDMHGNVWEWCLDGKRQYNLGDQTDPFGGREVEKADTRVIRGGSFDGAGAAASARFGWSVTSSDGYTGFRVCFRPE